MESTGRRVVILSSSVLLTFPKLFPKKYPALSASIIVLSQMLDPDRLGRHDEFAMHVS